MTNAERKLLRQPRLPRTSWGVKIWAAVLNVAIYGLLFWVLAQRQPITFHILRAQENSLFRHPAWLLLVVLLMLLATTAVHELGHLLAGQLVGLQFHLLVIGPLRITRRNGRLRWELRPNLALFNGLTGSAPLDERPLSRRLLIFTLGGPLASLLQAGTAIFFFRRLRSDVHFAAANGWTVEVAGIAAIFGIIYFLSSIKPGHYYSGLQADGGRIVSLLRGGAIAQRWSALIALNGIDLRGKRPRDWPEALVRQALVGYDHSHDCRHAREAAYRWSLDNGQIATANRWLEEAITIRPSLLPNTPAHLAWEKAYFAAFHLHDAQGGRRWLNRARQSKDADPRYQRAAAAVFLAEGRSEAARTQAETGLDHPTHTGVEKAEQVWLTAVRDRAAARENSEVSGNNEVK